MEVPTISVVLGGLDNQKATANPSRTSKPVMVKALSWYFDSLSSVVERVRY